MRKEAIISRDGRYRYQLLRQWDRSGKALLVIGLNPSTADSQNDDNTSRICINYAKKWNFGTLIIANLFAFRATDPKQLWKASDPVGPENDFYLQQFIQDTDLCLCAWSHYGNYQNRASTVYQWIKDPKCLCQLKNGSPGHPLYKSKDLKPVDYTLST